MSNKSGNGFEPVHFRMHPRVFAALGADLVTNDVVAVIELVKNAYDAFADTVWVRFLTDSESAPILEIEDNGHGMTFETVRDVWCMVATPFKVNNPTVISGEKSRRVAGEKGLGRLSVARIGNRLQMLTQAPAGDCWEVVASWSDITAGNDLSESYAKYRKLPGKSPFKKSGTLLRISELKTPWDTRIDDLEDNLSRLISPFSDIGDFTIYLTKPGDASTDEIKVESPQFLSKPKYSINGEVDKKGNITATYSYKPIKEGKSRTQAVKLDWEQVFDKISKPYQYPFTSDNSHCGPFSFEIRAWDIGPEDTREIADKFEFSKSSVRKAIRAHKGISVYRDGILVLPKSENARDWLGLDLRRVSRLSRLSTSELVGYVSISADTNPGISDTSDREGLASNLAVGEFEELLVCIVSLLENERNSDRIKPEREQPMEEIFASLDATELIADVSALAEENAPPAETLHALRMFSSSLDTARKTIQERFIHYSRMATVGTIAQMLVHEIRNRTTAIGSFLSFVKDRFGPFKDKNLEEEYRLAERSVSTLERLADTFSPLASRAFRRRKRQSIIEERIRECLSLQAGEIKSKGIEVRIPNTTTTVAVDPGELDAILLNLITNASYWLGQTAKDKRSIEFRITNIDDGSRVRVWVHDTGPGIREDDADKIFLPGVTRKPDGIGMGLTVASELVAEYGGEMKAKHPGTNGGASFAFDLPVRK